MPSDTHVKLTIKALDRMQPGDVLRDVAIGGFFAERGKRPRVSLKIQADLPDGRTVKMTLGQHPGSSLDEVRAEALRLLTEIKAGRDPREPKASPVTEEVWTVREVFAQYQVDMEIRGKSKRTANDLDGMLKNLGSWSEIVKKSRRVSLPKDFSDEKIPGRALDDWRDLPVTAITREMCRDRHKRLRLIGVQTANKTLKSLKTCLKFSKKARGYPADNPVEAVSFSPIRKGEDKPIPFDELRDWYTRLQRIPNPLRRIMQEVGLYTGLRPANLMECQKAWLDWKRHSISIPGPSMKGRAAFYCPMTAHIEQLMRRAIALSEKEFGQSPWVFPAWSRTGQVIPTNNHKEDLLPQGTGYTLRHTYSNMAVLAKVNNDDRDALIAHKREGITGVYVDDANVFPGLLVQQQRVTDFIRRVLETKDALETIVADAADQVRQPAQAQAVNTDKLLDAQALAEVLSTSLEEVEKMLAQGVPTIDVLGHTRFQFSEVLTWLRGRKKHLRAVE